MKTSKNIEENTEWRKKYDAHIRSAQWKGTRAAIFMMRGAKCEDCGYGSATLQLHHLTYERMGNERLTDLVILCRKCHVKADAKRDAETERKRKKREAVWRLDKQFNRWCAKRGVYGDAREDMVDAFNCWVDSDDFM